MNSSTIIQPVGGFIIRSLAVTPEGIHISYDAPGVGGVFAITNEQYETTGCSITIENKVGITTTIQGDRRLASGTYRIADIGGLPDKIYDLGSFQIPGPIAQQGPIPIQPYSEYEMINDTLRIPGPGKWFIATKLEDRRIVLPVIQREAYEIVVNNWASMSGFGPNDAKPIMIWITEPNGDQHPMLPLHPGESRTFVGIRTPQKSLRWAIL